MSAQPLDYAAMLVQALRYGVRGQRNNSILGGSSRAKREVVQSLVGMLASNVSNDQADSDQHLKQDAGKPDLSLLPSEVWALDLTREEVEGIARVREFGLAKYHDRESWRKVSADRYRAAASRHQLALRSGEELDQESGLPHRWHLLCNVMCMFAIGGGCIR